MSVNILYFSLQPPPPNDVHDVYLTFKEQRVLAIAVIAIFFF